MELSDGTVWTWTWTALTNRRLVVLAAVAGTLWVETGQDNRNHDWLQATAGAGGIGG